MSFEGGDKHRYRCDAGYFLAKTDALQRRREQQIQQDLLRDEKRSDDRRLDVRQYFRMQVLNEFVRGLETGLALLSLSLFIAPQRLKRVLDVLAVRQQ